MKHLTLSLLTMGNDNKVRAYLSLGSNIDDRIAYLAKAEEELINHVKIEVIKTSKIYETEPWPQEDLNDEHPRAEKGQKWFLNQVIEIQTSLKPQELLEEVQIIEKKFGRTKKHHWGPREIDIDILLYNNQVIDSPELEIPHRHMADRQFVLIPLVEIAPDIKHPGTGKKFSEILEELKDEHKVIPFL